MELQAEKENAVWQNLRQPIGKSQLYALLVDSSGNPVHDSDGNNQVVAIQSQNGKLQVDATINGSLANLPTVTILAGQSLSGAVDLSTQCLIGLSMPSTWSTAAVITFAGSVDGVTFNPIYYQGGEFIISEAAASRQITIDPTALLPWRYVKIRSGTASAPVNRSQDNVITLLTKPLA